MESMSVNELERTNQSTSAAPVWDTTPLLSLIHFSPLILPLSHFQSSWKKDKFTPLPILSCTQMASGSSKRARGANNGGNQPVCCLVDGCNSDLSNCRDYHRRHKVCELHSKTPQVSIAGLKQRFCQQCSRFHSLEEFDEGKRSCRKRLDGHNRRRRKPQTDLLPRSGGPFSYHQGAHLLPYTSSQVFPSTTVSSHSWSSAVSDGGGDIAAVHCRNQQLNFLEEQSLFVDHSNYKSAQPLAFLHSGPTTCQPLLRSINTLSENGRGGCSGGGGGESNKMIFSESDCALSLLSSPQPPQAAVSLLPPFRHHHNGNGFEHSDCSSGRIPHDTHGGAVNFTGMFGIGSDEAGNQSPSTLPFHWE